MIASLLDGSLSTEDESQPSAAVAQAVGISKHTCNANARNTPRIL